jgi:hypothetical protein
MVIVVGVLFMLATSPSKDASKRSVDDQEELRKDVAGRVEMALRVMAYLEMEGTIQQFDLIPERSGEPIGGFQPVTFRTRMAHQRFRTDVYREEKLIAAFSLMDGRIQEYRPQMNDRPLLEYDAPASHGTGDPVSKGEYDCLVGTQTYSWVRVGVDSEFSSVMSQADVFARFIRDGHREADAHVSGHDCYVFRRIFGVVPGSEERMPEHALYVDKETYVVRRWDTLNSGIHRIRFYHDIRVSGQPVADVVWKITASDRAEERPVEAVKLDGEKGWFSDKELNREGH